jgi:hypothetical protein
MLANLCKWVLPHTRILRGLAVTKPLRLVWGAQGIGKIINRTERQTYHLLGKGLIRAARKVGEQWTADESGLEEQFGPDSRDET